MKLPTMTKQLPVRLAVTDICSEEPAVICSRLINNNMHQLCEPFCSSLIEFFFSE